MTLVVFVPDPTTRPCPKHGDLMTDSMPCGRCHAEALIEDLMSDIERMFVRVLRASGQRVRRKPVRDS